jgi:hypothetical protein
LVHGEFSLWGVDSDGTSATIDNPIVFAIRGDGGQSVALAIVLGTSNAHCLDTGFSPGATFDDFSDAYYDNVVDDAMQ